WIPGYNQDLSRYSPGLLALIEVARAAPERGIERIDLGPGEELYKLRAATDFRDVGVASVSSGATVRAVSTFLEKVRVWSRGSKLGRIARATHRAVIRGAYAAGAGLSGTLGPEAFEPNERYGARAGNEADSRAESAIGPPHPESWARAESEG
ncbi:MAG TPA: GNAT family N-acetyltransferase, partial [Longimicrobiales bacterium]|nr:GNAT family N-acetyltransferase [Longimicrobiales bacterium]